MLHRGYAFAVELLILNEPRQNAQLRLTRSEELCECLGTKCVATFARHAIARASPLRPPVPCACGGRRAAVGVDSARCIYKVLVCAAQLLRDRVMHEDGDGSSKHLQSRPVIRSHWSHA